MEGVNAIYTKISKKITKDELGINGIPKLQKLAMWNMLDRTALDVMHGVFLGIANKLLSLWYKSVKFDEQFTLFDKKHWVLMVFVPA